MQHAENKADRKRFALFHFMQDPLPRFILPEQLRDVMLKKSVNEFAHGLLLYGIVSDIP